MEVINLIFILFIIIGFSLIIYALVELQKKQDKNDEIYSIEEGVKKIKYALEDVDKAIDELNKLAEQVFLQFDDKKNELLFLYDTIDQKQNSIIPKVDISVSSKDIVDFPKKDLNNFKDNESDGEVNVLKYENPFLEKIKEMKNKGMSTNEIAKTLNIGKGEVELIFELGKE